MARTKVAGHPNREAVLLWEVSYASHHHSSVLAGKSASSVSDPGTCAATRSPIPPPGIIVKANLIGVQT